MYSMDTSREYRVMSSPRNPALATKKYVLQTQRSHHMLPRIDTLRCQGKEMGHKGGQR